MYSSFNDYNILKKEFRKKFQTILHANINFREFIYEIFFYGTAYIIGGFLRDIILKKESRDLDMIIGLSQEKTIEILKSSKLNHQINRLNGFKISLIDFEVDIWCIENNWAFKENLVVMNDDNIIESISNCCFYNYDSLVINVHSENLNIKHFKSFIETKTLDIIQKNTNYKNLNPTIEANILRAFYLKKLYNISFTANCNNYILSRVGFLNDSFSSAITRLVEYKKKYKKYDEILNEVSIYEYIKDCQNMSKQIQIEI